MDKPKIKALFFDVDGTLVGYESHKIDPRDIESLRKLNAAGFLLFIATGRDLRIPAEAKIVEPVLPLVTGVINANGQQCFLTDGTVISDHSLVLSDFLPIRRVCEENHIAILYYIGNDSYITEMTGHVTAFAEHVRIDIPPVRPLDDGTAVPEKVCLYITPEEEAELIRPLMKQTWSARNTEHLIDLIPVGIGKDSGIREVCAWFGISTEEAAAFGDGENDLPMLRTAGIGIAMGEADEQIKDAADLITGTPEEAGISRALVRMGLLA